MQILAIDTTGDACSCALLCGDVVTEDSARVPRAHTRHLLPMIQTRLATAGITLPELDAVAFAAGPGSFTGVRIATSMAQGLAMAAGIGTIPVSTLAALALAAHESLGAERIVACSDARMGEVYFGCFEYLCGEGLRCVGDEHLAAPGDVVLPDEGQWVGVGSGFQAHDAVLAGARGQRLTTTHPELEAGAAQVARLARESLRRHPALPPTQAAPRYLRDKVAQTRAERAIAQTSTRQSKN